MTRKLRSSTGRGLSTAYAGEILAIVACVLYVVTQAPRVLVLGFLFAGLVGFASIVSLWRGQDEFGPQHRHMARRGTYLYFIAGLFFLLSFLSFGTFPSTTLGLDLPGDDEAQSPTTPHRFRDLLPPLFLLGIAIVAETLSGAHLLWILAGEQLRRAVVVYAASGGVLAIIVLARGIAQVGELRSSFGENAANADLAAYYFEVFLAAVLPLFAVGFAVTRGFALYLLRVARAKVAQAEAEAEPGGAEATMPS